MFHATRTSALALLLAGSTLLAACGGDGGTGPADDQPDDEPTQEGTFFALENHSSRDAFYVYIRACGATEWGDDRLGSSRILDVDERITWTVNQPGCYDIKALSDPTGGRQQAVWPDVQVPADRTTTIALRDADWGAMD